ncbi:type II secretion system protein [Candidatus Sumerlaeota bacterium]|nr:type II secretion system protein [Candidatus Sumerlaeota bacterium]
MPSLRRRRGFTLVEMLIVGALIALFSGLAIFGVQQQFRSNTRKAAIGESRQIATALEFANMDTSIFPKLCWLAESNEGLLYFGGLINSGSPRLPFIFSDINSRLATNPPAANAFGGGVERNWKGPYFAMSQGRAGVAQGRGGFVYMLIPELQGFDATNPNNVDSSEGLRWPADPYNNPWVVYMMDIDRSDPARPFLKFVNEKSGASPAIKGDFVNAVVSYGNNHYPGGTEDVRMDFGTVPGNDTNVAVDGNNAWGLRLYKGSVGYRPTTKGYITHTYLRGGTGVNGDTEFTRARANIWSRKFALDNIGLFSGGINSLPNDGKNNGAASVVGITDSGSDDIVFEF